MQAYPYSFAALVSGRSKKGLTNDLKLFLDIRQHVETVATEYFKSDEK